jgi:hypothetical protein
MITPIIKRNLNPDRANMPPEKPKQFEHEEVLQMTSAD